MFKFNNKNTRTTSMTSFCYFVVNFEHVSHFCLVFLLLILDKPFKSKAQKTFPKIKQLSKSTL